MNQLQKATTGRIFKAGDKNQKVFASVFYHDIFDYPLSEAELIKWQAGGRIKIKQNYQGVNSKDGYYFLAGKDSHILSRILRKRISDRKLRIARKAGQILSSIPSIKMVGITGALAMQNAGQDSDIDLIIVCKKGTLWTTRLVALIVFKLTGFPIRKFGDKNQKDKLCLNMWLDEADLAWPKKDRNTYTSHEICQITPLFNKQHTHERLIWENKWITDFWPNAAKLTKTPGLSKKRRYSLIEMLARKIQYLYMKKKITREVISPTRAIFHPHDWGSVIRLRLTS